MPIERSWILNTIFTALFFLFIGFLSSPTVVSLYHILIIIPTIVLYSKGHKVHQKLSTKVLMLLFFWALICTLVNFGELHSVHKSFNDLKYYLFGALLIVPIKYFWVHGSTGQKKILLNTFFVIVVVGFFVGISRAWWRFDPIKWEHSDKYLGGRSGGFLNYMRYGYASSFIALLSISVLIHLKKIDKFLNRPLFLAASILSLAAIFTAKVRGALLGFLVAVPFLIYRYRPKVALSVVGCGVLFVAIVIYQSFYGASDSRMLNINDHSNKVRLSQYYTAIKATSENPIFGLGADEFSYHVTDLKNKYNIWANYYSGHSHNIILEHAANYGILGALLFILFIVCWLVEMIRINSAFSWAIASYIVAFCVAGQFELLFDNANSHLFFFIYSFSQAFLSTQTDSIS